MYGITGEFRRFCFDQAVITFGRALEAELDSVKGKGDKGTTEKKQRVLAKWLDKPMKFREPVATTSPTAGTSSGEGGEGHG